MARERLHGMALLDLYDYVGHADGCVDCCIVYLPITQYTCVPTKNTTIGGSQRMHWAWSEWNPWKEPGVDHVARAIAASHHDRNLGSRILGAGHSPCSPSFFTVWSARRIAVEVICVKARVLQVCLNAGSKVPTIISKFVTKTLRATREVTRRHAV
ncbi:hypothetical protein BDV95DRAFT_396619 [Massariosphaeria phaeospora]|uniref:Uncharacterized protein n=1 Tax=Massariosphaeria phaeospora TaxID=100035 RepID=A0A7C8M9X1_9PLEO|nr:hypothetical protein BDV95DRAFT_396619 [Massariosphaeria phaeospora]